MRKNFKWKLIAFLAVMGSLLLLGGCKFQYTLEEKREETGMNACVTYYTNDKGAYFGTSDTMKRIYLPAGAVAMNIGTDKVTNGTIPTPTRENYILVGWYEAEKGPTGEIMLDEDGNVVLKAEAFDFKTRLQNGDDIVLYAKWQKNEGIHVYLLCDEITETEPFTITVGEGDEAKEVSVANNEKLAEYQYTQSIWYKTDMPKAKGYTFYGLYEDIECTKEVSATVNQNEKGDYTVYAKYIKGNWKILRTPADVKSTLFSAAYIQHSNFYLANDIDCKDITINSLGAFSKNLQGNGYTIKNLVIDAGEIKQSEVVVSTFGRITSRGKMENVTFENITFNSKLVTENAEVRAYAFVFMQSMDAGATINNVALKGEININIVRDKICVYSNMIVETEDGYAWDYSNVLFGGEGTDSEQVANGLTVDVSGITEINIEMKDIYGNDNYVIELKKQTRTEE